MPDRRPRRSHRAFVGFSLACGSLGLAGLGGHLAVGRRLVERAWREAHAAGEASGTLGRALAAADERVLLAVVAVGLVWAVGAVAFALSRLRWRGRVALLVGLVLLYGLLEQVVAPRTAETVGLHQLIAVRDPDHRPHPNEGGCNADGLRQKREAADYAPEDLNIVFLGDSFTMGVRLSNVNDAFPTLVERRLQAEFPGARIRVANFGWTSSSPLLSLRRLRDIGARYHPDLVVTCVDMTDPHDEIKWANLLERRGLCAWYDRIPFTLRLLYAYAPGAYGWVYDRMSGGNLPYHRFFATEQPLEESRPFLAPLRANLDGIDAEARQLGAASAVFVFPRWFQYSDRECPRDWEMLASESRHTVLGPYSTEIFRWFDEQAETAEYPIFSLLEVFRSTDVFPTCFEDDPHWNEGGHRVAADAIAERLIPLVRSRLP